MSAQAIARRAVRAACAQAGVQHAVGAHCGHGAVLSARRERTMSAQAIARRGADNVGEAITRVGARVGDGAVPSAAGSER